MGFSKQFTENEIVFIINDKILNDSLVKKIVKNIKPYLSLILKNGKLHSYMNFNDFKNNKRELIRRRFIVLN